MEVSEQMFMLQSNDFGLVGVSCRWFDRPSAAEIGIAFCKTKNITIACSSIIVKICYYTFLKIKIPNTLDSAGLCVQNLQHPQKLLYIVDENVLQRAPLYLKG